MIPAILKIFTASSKIKKPSATGITTDIRLEIAVIEMPEYWAEKAKKLNEMMSKAPTTSADRNQGWSGIAEKL